MRTLQSAILCSIVFLTDETNTPYGRTDRITNWYIFTHINRVTKFPDDRILLVIGSGHLTTLSDFARSSSYFCLENTEDCLK